MLLPAISDLSGFFQARNKATVTINRFIKINKLLPSTAARLADWVGTHEDAELPDLAYTLARRRAHRPVRTAVIAGSSTELIDALRAVAEGDTPYQAAVGHDDRGPVWVFSGQGSQWAQMGAQLLADEPEFAATVARIEPMVAVSPQPAAMSDASSSSRAAAVARSASSASALTCTCASAEWFCSARVAAGHAPSRTAAQQ